MCCSTCDMYSLGLALTYNIILPPKSMLFLKQSNANKLNTKNKNYCYWEINFILSQRNTINKCRINKNCIIIVPLKMGFRLLNVVQCCLIVTLKTCWLQIERFIILMWFLATLDVLSRVALNYNFRTCEFVGTP
jgi:hypothetical protein